MLLRFFYTKKRKNVKFYCIDLLQCFFSFLVQFVQFLRKAEAYLYKKIHIKHLKGTFHMFSFNWCNTMGTETHLGNYHHTCQELMQDFKQLPGSDRQNAGHCSFFPWRQDMATFFITPLIFYYLKTL